MFTFQFDIDDAEDTDGIGGLEGITTSNIENVNRHGSNPSPEMLEPFSELSLNQLVRAHDLFHQEVSNP